MRRWIIALGIVLVAGLAAALHVRRPPPATPLTAAVGVGERPADDRVCRWVVRDRRVGTWPTGEVGCTWYRRETPERRADRHEVVYHVLTRRVHWVARSWEPSSERAWRQAVDSLQAVLRDRGGRPTCDRRASHDPDHVRAYWELEGGEVALFTGRDTLTLPGARAHGPRWFLFLRGTSGRFPECGGLLAPPV